jgi:hypothetical protein
MDFRDVDGCNKFSIDLDPELLAAVDESAFRVRQYLR